MAMRQQRSVWVGLLSWASVLVLFGCAEPTAPPLHGELELSVDPQASYAMVGRFRVSAIDPYSPSRDIDFDTSISSARIELPPGSFTLALGAGARLVCAGEDAELSAPSVIPRLVSASPRVFAIKPGQVTTARISFGGTHPDDAETATALGASLPSDLPDPCGASLEIAKVASALR